MRASQMRSAVGIGNGKSPDFDPAHQQHDSPVVDAAAGAVDFLVRDAPRPDAFHSAVARSAGQGTRASAARDALALDPREHGGIQPS